MYFCKLKHTTVKKRKFYKKSSYTVIAQKCFFSFLTVIPQICYMHICYENRVRDTLI